MGGRMLLVAALATLALPAVAGAQINGPTLPANDLEALLSLTGGQVVDPFGVVTKAPAPPLAPVPRATCDAQSSPLPADGVQGRVTAADVASPQAAKGWTCNTTLVATHDAYPGGFRVWRYADANGHVCAYYDTSFASPANVVSVAGGPSPGVVVLDMTDPAHPQQTTVLRSLAMLAPHESLNLNTRRGLLAAEVGNGLTLPGSMAIYDVAGDCRRPQLLAEIGSPYGHESGFAPDGNTYWIAGGAGEVRAVDVRDPRHPVVLWRGAMYSHGLGLSDDGRTLFQTDPINGNLGILDVSEVQDRRANPKVHQLSRITWDTVSIPQNAVPLTIGGRPYVLEFDEFAFRFNPVTIDDRAGAARLIDISDPRAPRIVSDLRLEVNMRDAHRAATGDPSAMPGPFMYGAHYCAAPREVDPVIVACSFLNSGLRVFDVRDPEHPKETASFVAPPRKGTLGGLFAGNFALSQPAFDPARREVWYTDGTSGFSVLRLSEAGWPSDPKPARAACTPRRRVTITLPRGLRAATVTAGGRRVRVTRRAGRLRAVVDLRGRTSGRVTVRVLGRTRAGRVVTQTRRLAVCRTRARPA